MGTNLLADKCLGLGWRVTGSSTEFRLNALLGHRMRTGS